MAMPTIAPVERPVEPEPEFSLELESSVVVDSEASAVLVGVDVASELATVTVAVSARLCIDVFASAGSGCPGVKTYSASYTSERVSA